MTLETTGRAPPRWTHLAVGGLAAVILVARVLAVLVLSLPDPPAPDPRLFVLSWTPP